MNLFGCRARASATPAGQKPALSEAELENAKRVEDAIIANRAEVQKNLMTVAAGSIDRSRTGATAVVTASTAITAVYTGLLGYVFGLEAEPLPARALLSPIFLALSIVLSTGYLAYIVATRRVMPIANSGGWESQTYQRVNLFVRYTKRIVERRVWLLQAAVVALGIGVAYIALPFIAPGSTQPEPVTTSIPQVNWPTPDPTATGDSYAALYEAQLDQAVAEATIEARLADEVAAKEAAKEADESWMDSSNFFYQALIAGLAILVLIPAVTFVAGRLWHGDPEELRD